MIVTLNRKVANLSVIFTPSIAFQCASLLVSLTYYQRAVSMSFKASNGHTVVL